MSIRVTDSSNVALYDSVTGIAFGGTFESTDDAESFLDYVQSLEELDLRVLPAVRISALRMEWESKRDPAVRSDVTIYGAGSA